MENTIDIAIDDSLYRWDESNIIIQCNVNQLFLFSNFIKDGTPLMVRQSD